MESRKLRRRKIEARRWKEPGRFVSSICAKHGLANFTDERNCSCSYNCKLQIRTSLIPVYFIDDYPTLLTTIFIQAGSRLTGKSSGITKDGLVLSPLLTFAKDRCRPA